MTGTHASTESTLAGPIFRYYRRWYRLDEIEGNDILLPGISQLILS